MIMKKIFKKFTSTLLISSFILALGLASYPETLHAQVGTCTFSDGSTQTGISLEECRDNGGSWDVTTATPGPNPPSGGQPQSSGCGVTNLKQCFLDALLLIPGAAAVGVLKLTSYLTHLSGALLNYVIRYSVVDMKDHLSTSTINDAWKVFRDIANMSFIFILLYSAIMTIVGKGQDNKKLIVNVVIVAVLINFSLFFTQIVIDIANLLAITFYDAIAPGALKLTMTQGLSASLMEPLKLQSIWDVTGGLEGGKLFTIGVMGTIVTLIAAFIFFAVAIMFVIRFVVLTFVMILSPLALLGMVLPELKSKVTNKWVDALVGQAFFAPIYFLLTWVVILISRGLIKGQGSMAVALSGAVDSSGVARAPDPGSIGILLNFILMIALLITSLVLAKEWANKAPGGIGQLTGLATKWSADKAFGGMGALGRKTIGRGGEALTNMAAIQDAAKNRIGFKGAGARLALYAGQKARSGTFDVRNATMPTSAIGAAIEGTVGRTKLGKKMGLDEVRIPSIPVGSLAADQTGVGTGGTKGFREFQAEKAKRIEAREKAATTEYRQVMASADISKGAAVGAGAAQIATMEKSLAKMSEKEIEAIVDSNRELLNSQNFANALSVKQLEALNKSDKFSDEEKDHIKENRFRAINVGMAAPGPLPAAAVTDIKALTDAELEMINPNHLSDTRFVSALRGGQVEAINKSNKFTRAQKGDVRIKRREPLDNAIVAANAPLAQNELRKFSPKDIVAMGMGVINNPLLYEAYTPNMLKRMAADMNTADIQTLRTALLTGPHALPAGHETRVWLLDPNTGVIDFS
jgi:hypothetical protein